ncbi:hypothetical protein BDY17DRAFT_317370 [Neohortaea acidophila]|uniref:OTU domain-containing protein n=1 Tax=Neohortaea acidophila TaxID=245834 RepID=A0A6A6PRW1_9PEZI|nr:uncharacterized protein BDY17DRAFT_317370 [Neohortaea acidophila]KAF2482840.1 hypothetical protein BDY17DRAFT_317370 [Neohortaea acidophila]
MAQLQTRHRKEQRDLQSRITQKKKQANKKTRKGVNDECDRLEAELKERQQSEVAALTGEAVGDDVPSNELLDLSIEADAEPPRTNGTAHDDAGKNEPGEHPDTASSLGSQAKKPNRQKARLARRAAEQEELLRQAAEEAKSLPDLKEQERTRMLDAMKERGMQEKEIRADGHCLYSAVADQLHQLDIPLAATINETAAYQSVRAVAAEYIEKHREDFEPFLEEPFPEYVGKIRNTGEWGGQLELMALAKSYATDIYVLQDFGRVEKIESGGSASEKTMWLAYYKHGFGLGEHYNSLRKAP